MASSPCGPDSATPVAVRIYRWLQRRLLPEIFVRRHGRDMSDTFAAVYAVAGRRAGLRGRTRAAVRDYLDLLRFALRERRRRRRLLRIPRGAGGTGSPESPGDGRDGDRDDPLVGGLWHGLGELVRDVRFSIRSLARAPGFFLLTTITLGLGIGGSVALFGVYRNVFLSPLPFPDGERLVRLRDSTAAASGDVRVYNMAPLNFFAIRERSDLLEDVVGQRGSSVTLLGSEAPERVAAVLVSEGWAESLGIEPWIGRTFTDSEARLGRESDAAVISHALWQRRFGGDPDVLGRSLPLASGSRQIVGVLRPGFSFPYDAEIWLPAIFDRSDGVGHDLHVLARTAPGTDIAAARRELETIAADLSTTYPETHASAGLWIEPARENFYSDQADTPMALFAAVAFLLLLACVNVSNVLIARFLGRREEVGIRAALGAGRFRQIRALLVETQILFLVGGGLGLLIMSWLSEYLSVLVPSVLREQLGLGEVGIGWDLVLFALGISIGCGLLFGLVAAARGTGTPGSDLVKGSRHGTVSAGRRRLQSALVIAQVALAVVLLSGAAAMAGHFRDLQRADLGIRLEGLTTARSDLRAVALDDPEARATLVRGLLDELEALPGVEEAGITTVNPLCCGDWGMPVAVEGREPVAEGSEIVIHHRMATPGLFEAMGIPVLEGRAIASSDDGDAEPVVVVDERFARRFFPGGSAIGRRVRSDRGAPGPWRRIVGVVGAVQDAGDYTETWYVPYLQEPTGRSTYNLHYMLRSAEGTTIPAPSIRGAVQRIAPRLPVHEARTMAEVFDESLVSDRLGAVVSTLLGVFALALATLGVYALMSYFVAEQRAEMGIRVALGASGRQVVRLVLGRSAWTVGAGILAGAVGAILTHRLLRSIVADMVALSPLTLSAIVTILAATTLLASGIPAVRAARTDPAEVLQEE